MKVNTAAAITNAIHFSMGGCLLFHIIARQGARIAKKTKFWISFFLLCAFAALRENFFLKIKDRRSIPQLVTQNVNHGAGLR
ncbi:MAG: hypothetical protein QUS13_00010, partial [Smithella sp.]|nr:hypothetical protein [Smithella sp.]